ncbi:MAG: flagellar motor switch protein FliG, partial [Pseudomonadota bacterium]
MTEGFNALDKSAILLLSLGEEGAAEVLKHLAPKEVQRIGNSMAALTSINRTQIENVLNNFFTDAQEQTSVGVGSDDYIRKMLVNALGEEKAGGLADRILMGGNTSGLDTLKWMDSRSVSDIIRFEHPQIQAIVLAYLDPDQ